MKFAFFYDLGIVWKCIWWKMEIMSVKPEQQQNNNEAEWRQRRILLFSL